VIALAGSVLVTSLIGSPHCAGMCGGFVGFYAGQGRVRVWPHVAYNLGRLVSYTVLGAIAGAAGAGIEHAGATVGVGRAAAIAAGVLMMTWGTLNLLGALGVSLRRTPSRPSPMHRTISAALARVQAQPPAVRAATIGLLSTLLPCGWLYAFVAVAAGTGAPLSGAMVMATFWVGTLPVMTGVAVVARTLLGGLARRLPVVAAIVMIALGMLTLAGRMTPHLHAGHHGPHPQVTEEDAVPAEHDHAAH